MYFAQAQRTARLDLAEVDWEEHFLPDVGGQILLAEKAHRDLDETSWEDRFLP